MHVYMCIAPLIFTNCFLPNFYSYLIRSSLANLLLHAVTDNIVENEVKVFIPLLYYYLFIPVFI